MECRLCLWALICLNFHLGSGAAAAGGIWIYNMRQVLYIFTTFLELFIFVSRSVHLLIGPAPELYLKKAILIR
jgi:hypothetical protein